MDEQELPEFVLDHLGNEVRVGDTIVYAALLGRSATVSVSEVLGFAWSKSDYGEPELKIRVQGTEYSRYTDSITQKAPGLLIAKFRRFVLLHNKPNT